MADLAPRPQPSLSSTPALSDVADFLAAHAPFESVDRDELARVASCAEVEFHLAGAIIFSQGAEPVEHLRVVRSGAVEIVLDERVLDRLESGEMFGHASMLSGLPPGFAARAAEDTLCYRIPADVARELLSRPEGMRYVARSLLEWPAEAVGALELSPAAGPAHVPVGSLVHGAPVVCEPGTSIQEAAAAMSSAGATSVVVDLGDGSLGILTDHDLRTRVVAAGVAGDAPVSVAMTAPAYTCGPDRLAGEVLLDMLDRGLRHYPIVSASGELLGVVSDSDLVAVETRSSFHLRRAIGRAQSRQELVAASAAFAPMVIALHDARVDPANISAIYTVVLDALTRRLLELAVAERGGAPPSFAWLALGSQARREATPGSDSDSAIVYFDEDGGETVRPFLQGVGAEVVAGLEACGLRRDAQGVTAAEELVVRSLASWQRAVRGWMARPTQEQAVMLVSVFVDSRPVWGIHMGTPIADTFATAPRDEALLRLLARLALSYRPPTGFLRGLVVEHSGENRGRLDLKRGGLLPVVDLARWAGMAAGVTSASTRERLRAAADAGTLSRSTARTLEDAFDLILGLRLEHQVQQLRAGAQPDDYIDPESLSELTRSYLKEAFRAIASVQRRVSAELALGVL
ncbi:MAG TPA: putative nucleotidyltransferase substrate binding domain-containing protein [Solirubrobacteraceae bacterium]|nr:putative nucleotidyltransferase substrate binding domain-containing protein [Solirubrobacteraceae bacterium]